MATSVRILVVGDSLAFSLQDTLSRLVDRYDFELRSATYPGLGIGDESERLWGGVRAPIPTDWLAERNERWRELVAGFDPDVALLMTGCWEVQSTPDLQFATVEHTTARFASLNRAIDLLNANGGLVGLVTSPYFARRKPSPEEQAAARNFFGVDYMVPPGPFPENRPSRIDWWNSLLLRASENRPAHARLVDLGAVLTPTRPEIGAPTGSRGWDTDDGVHFDPDTALPYVERVVPDVLALGYARKLRTERGRAGRDLSRTAW